MSYNVHIPNNNGDDDRTESTPLTVGSTISTDGTFSTITLDNSQQQRRWQQQQQQQGRFINDNVNNMASSSCLLLFFVTVAFVAGIIQLNYGVWWGVGMNALLVITGTASLVVKHKYKANDNDDDDDDRMITAKYVHFVTLCVWATSAIIGLILFAGFVAFHGNETLFRWCLSYSRGNYLDYSSVTMNTCAALSEDGTLRMIWIAAVISGVVLELPLMYIAVRTVYIFYFEVSSVGTRAVVLNV